jgi:hypothetical protein
MFKNVMQFAVLVTFLSVVRSFTLCKPDHHFILNADKMIHEKKTQRFNLLLVKECKCRAKRRPVVHLNHVSEYPFVTVNIPSSGKISGSGTLICNVSVREAIDVQDVDAVALLRCRCVRKSDIQFSRHNVIL